MWNWTSQKQQKTIQNLRIESDTNDLFTDIYKDGKIAIDAENKNKYMKSYS